MAQLRGTRGSMASRLCAAVVAFFFWLPLIFFPEKRRIWLIYRGFAKQVGKKRNGVIPQRSPGHRIPWAKLSNLHCAHFSSLATQRLGASQRHTSPPPRLRLPPPLKENTPLFTASMLAAELPARPGCIKSLSGNVTYQGGGADWGWWGGRVSGGENGYIAHPLSDTLSLRIARLWQRARRTRPRPQDIPLLCKTAPLHSISQKKSGFKQTACQKAKI